MRLSVPVFVLDVLLAWSSPTSALAEWEISDPLPGEVYGDQTDIVASGNSPAGTNQVRAKLLKNGVIIVNQLVNTTNQGGDWSYNFGPRTRGNYDIELWDPNQGMAAKDTVLIEVEEDPE